MNDVLVLRISIEANVPKIDEGRTTSIYGRNEVENDVRIEGEIVIQRRSDVTMNMKTVEVISTIDGEKIDNTVVMGEDTRNEIKANIFHEAIIIRATSNEEDTAKVDTIYSI